MQQYRRSLTVRCSPEAGETIEKIADLIGWSQNKIAANLVERALPLLKNACAKEDLLAIIRILLKGKLSVDINQPSGMDRRGPE